ncbi:DUF4392 domain-containing protein [Sulfurospirillum sp. 1612]|uniref:DUF4392 domain-containing protein n=1 Tax=Sulfurospirillum sp. 1612 TaxID=3094835 RepID=UPI002F94D54D
MKNSKTIDEIILQHSTRKMDLIQEAYPVLHSQVAVEHFVTLPKGVVFLYTGFYVSSFAETDGPLGTYFLARALRTLGYTPIIITDEYCDGFFKEIEVIHIPLDGHDEEHYLTMIHQHQPICHISIERCGKNANGIYANMRGDDISPFTAPVDELFELGRRFAPTFAIGDGGNEVGMGNFKTFIQESLSLVPCVVKSDFPIIASVSNWGAYGFIAHLEKLTQKELLPTFDAVDDYLRHIVSLGSIDGVTKKNEKTVDGKAWTLEQNILEELKKAARFSDL